MLIKPQIRPLIRNDSRRFIFLDNLNLPRLPDVSLVTIHNKASNMFETRLINSNQDILAREAFWVLTQKKNIEGFSMKVNTELRKNGLGEILRLASIIDMFENNLNQINIFSKNSAIFFHSKYKFTPAIKSFDAAKLTLENIVANTQNDSPALFKRAQELLRLVETSNITENKTLNNSVNCFVAEYISKVLSGDKDLYLNRQFPRGFGMVLTKENVLKQKDFFNSLVQKHSIDYEF